MPARIGTAPDPHDKKRERRTATGARTARFLPRSPQEDTKGNDVLKEHEALVVQAGNKMRAAKQTFLKVEPYLECRINQLSQNECPCAGWHNELKRNIRKTLW